jgi:hypothetical protein
VVGVGFLLGLVHQILGKHEAESRIKPKHVSSLASLSVMKSWPF